MRTNLCLEPWLLSFEQRKEVFNDAKRRGVKIALYFAKEPDISTFRYRCFNTYQVTLSSQKWQAVYFYQMELDEVLKMINCVDLLVFARTRWNNSSKILVDAARKKHIPTVFDVDDLVFDKKYVRVVTNTIGDLNALDYWLPYFSDMNEMAKRTDGFLVTNDLLGKKIGASFGRSYKVIRNSMNKEQIQASEAYLCVDREYSKKQFTVGYFGGSPTHENDLAVALPEVIEFLRRHKNAKLRVVGYMNFEKNCHEFLREGRIEFVPFVDFRKLQGLLAEVDVNIAPLVLNDFTNCKSELKFFEAAAVETTTIASPTYTFKKAIKDGENGFLAYPGEWYDKLEYLYEHPDENRKIAREARKYALKHYYGTEFLKEVEEAYDYFVK